jgi:hypothetical protein
MSEATTYIQLDDTSGEFRTYDDTGSLVSTTAGYSNYAILLNKNPSGELYVRDFGGSSDRNLKLDSNKDIIWERGDAVTACTFTTGGDPVYIAGKNLFRVNDSDGSEVWSTPLDLNGDGTNDNIQGVAQGPNGNIVATTDVEDGKSLAILDPADGSVLNSTSVGGSYDPSGVATADDTYLYVNEGGGDVIYRFSADLSSSTTISNYGDYVEHYSIRLDNSGYAYIGSASHLAKIDVASSQMSIVWSVSTSADVRQVAPTTDGNVYCDIGNTISYRDGSDGSVIWDKSFDQNTYGPVNNPPYDAYPDSWQTTVTKSASPTKVAGTSSQNTPQGTRVGALSASKVASQSTQNAGTGTRIVTSSASVTASSTTPSSPSSTTSASPQATTVGATSTLPTVQTSVPAIATHVPSSASPKTVSVSDGVNASSSKVSSTTKFGTPSVLTGNFPSKAEYLYTGSDTYGLDKYDTSGNVVWGDTNVYASDISVDASGNVYVGREDYSEYRSYDTDGNERWSITTSYSITGASDATETGYLFILQSGSGDAQYLTKMDSTDGSTIWEESWINQGSDSLAVDSNDNIYVNSAGGDVRKYASDGTVLWTVSHYSNSVDLHVSGSDTPYAINGSDVVELDPSDGSQVATNTLSNSPIGVSVGEEETFYISYDGGSADYVARYDFPSDTVEWETELPSDVSEFVDSNVQGDIYVSQGSSYPSIEIYNASDGSHSSSISTSTRTGLAMYPNIASNQSAWTVSKSASITSAKLGASSILDTPSSMSLASPSPGSVGAVASPSTPSPTVTSGARATAVAGSASPQTPTPVGTAPATSTTYGAVSTPTTPESTGIVPASASTVPAESTLLTPFVSDGPEIVATKYSATTTQATPTGSVGKNAGAGGVSAQSTPFTGTGTRITIASAGGISSQSTLNVPTPTGIQSTQAQSVTGTASLSQATGAIGIGAVSQPCASTTTQFTGVGNRVGNPTAKTVSSTASLSSPTLSGGASTRGTRYGASATPSAPRAFIVGDAVATKHNATSTLLTAIEFERRISSIRKEGNGSQIEETRNQAEFSSVDDE